MNKRQAEQEIAVELFKRMISSIERKLADKVALKKSVKYDQKGLNDSLSSDFGQIKEVVQGLVNAYYRRYYPIDNFAPFSLDCFDYALEQNLKLIESVKKLLKFIS